MWYFAWILGLPLAAAFAVLNAMWCELMEDDAIRRDRLEPHEKPGRHRVPAQPCRVRAAPGPFVFWQDMRGTGLHGPARALKVIRIPHRLPK